VVFEVPVLLPDEQFVPLGSDPQSAVAAPRALRGYDLTEAARLVDHHLDLAFLLPCLAPVSAGYSQRGDPQAFAGESILVPPQPFAHVAAPGLRGSNQTCADFSWLAAARLLRPIASGRSPFRYH